MIDLDIFTYAANAIDEDDAFVSASLTTNLVSYEAEITTTRGVFTGKGDTAKDATDAAIMGLRMSR